MSSSLKSCCVPGCRDRVSKRHVITRKETCRKIWLERINNKKLSFDVYSTSYRICEAHFERECFVAGKLNKLALPTLNLKDYVRTGSDFLFSPPIPNGRVTPTKIRELLQLPSSTLSDPGPVGTVKKPVFTYSKKSTFDVDNQLDEHLFNKQTVLDLKAASARISQQLSTNLVTSQENLENVSEKKSPPRCLPLKENLGIVPVARTRKYSKKSLVKSKTNNRNDACSPKKNLGSSKIVVTYPIASTPECTEIPLIACDADTGNSTGFLKKSLAPSARISQQLSTNLVTSQENLENVSEKKSSPRCLSLKENLKIAPVARTQQYSKKSLVERNNRNDARSPKKNLGSSEIVFTYHLIASTPEHTEIPFIVCDTDTGNSTGFLKKSVECRTCLEIITDDNKICLDTEVVAKITILEALKKLADIQVPETDLLPQQICEKCFHNLQTAVNFTTQVISSDEKLKSRLPSLTDPLLIKPEPGVIKTEECNTLDNNVNKPLEDIETKTFKMEMVEENIERFTSSETTDISNADVSEIGVNPENVSVDDYLKKKYLYESTIPLEESLKKLPPKEIVHPEYMVYHNDVRTPNVSDNSCLCPECGKIFRTRIGCQVHINRMHNKMIRTSDKACLCPKCGKMFYARKGYQQHIKKVHTRLIKKIIISYSCPDCKQYISGNKTKVLTHMVGHSNKRRRIRTPHTSCLCPECGKIFKSKWNCTAHLGDVHYKNMTVVPRKRTTLCIDCGRSISGSKKKFLAHCLLYHSNKIS